MESNIFCKHLAFLNRCEECQKEQAEKLLQIKEMASMPNPNNLVNIECKDSPEEILKQIENLKKNLTPKGEDK